MTVNFPLPRLSDGPPSKNIQELKSYLYRLVEQLNYTINSLDSLQAVEASAASGSPSGGGGGGVSELAELDDVSLSSPGNNQVLGYNATSQKWENMTPSASRHNYSTTEQVVGTWIDGKSVYERVFIINGYFQSGEFNISHDASIDTPISHTAYGHIWSGGYVGSPRIQPVSSGGNSYVNADITFELMNIATDTFKFFVGNTWATNTTYRFDKIIVICRYTKTTD